VLALALAGCSTGGLFGGTPSQLNNQLFFATPCAGYTPTTIPYNGAICVDTATGGTSYWTGSAFVAGTDQFNRLAASASGVTAPTSGTGTVTAGGTDSMMEVTGCTSACTVTFGKAFTNQPFCICGDETSATGVCKVVPNANGATAVVTTAGTDSFVLECVANAK
jgi:hypothetical protein